MQISESNFSGILPVRTKNCILFIDFAEIIWIKAARKFSLLYVKGQEEIIKSVFSFSTMEAMLPTSFFFKCHRSTIINLMHLKMLDKLNRKIYLTNNQCVIISEALIKDFMNRINI